MGISLFSISKFLSTLGPAGWRKPLSQVVFLGLRVSVGLRRLRSLRPQLFNHLLAYGATLRHGLANSLLGFGHIFGGRQ